MGPATPHIDTPPPFQPEGEPVLLGEGSQYRVYDVAEDRVLKVPQTQEGSEAAIATWYKESPEGIPEYARKISFLRDQGASYVRNLVNYVDGAYELFGRPDFNPDGSFTQDKMTPMGEILKTASPEEAQRLLDGYIGIIKQSWDMGCFDWVFNMASNVCVSKSGRVVLSDFGEMGFERSTAEALIADRRWEKSYDAQHVLTDEQRTYFFAQAQKKLTKESLGRHWRRALPV